MNESGIGDGFVALYGLLHESQYYLLMPYDMHVMLTISYS